jgi:subtilisin family serine protease
MTVERTARAGAGSVRRSAGCGGRTRRLGLVAGCLLATGLLAPANAEAVPSAPASSPTVPVIVRELPGAGDRPERAVAEAGGRLLRPLQIIGGFLADVPAPKLPALRRVPGVHSVTPNTVVQLHDADEADAASTATSVRSIAAGTGASELWADGLTGRGVDVALIDTGVVPVNGLRTPGKLVFGPDLSLEAATCGTGGCAPSPARQLDSFGHGTHLAGIIAGRDDTVSDVRASADEEFVGLAPDARVVSVKVADASGATDVSQVIAAIDWVVQHRNRDGLNIRVLNLAFGTDGLQDYRLDPLAYAAEVAWRKGIFVVAAAGNGGTAAARLDNPAHDPYLLAVAGADGRGTPDLADDDAATWSSRGDGRRNPDLIAPGTRIVSLRNPGSHLDARFPEARQGDRFFRGSGTSQAAAVVSGAASLLLEQRPGLTPDQLKALLTSTARPLTGVDVQAQGAGALDLRRARSTPTPTAKQRWAKANGKGSLEAARGSRHVTIGGELLSGETDVRGRAWNGHTWNGHTWNGHTWNGHTWNGHTWGS